MGRLWPLVRTAAHIRRLVDVAGRVGGVHHHRGTALWCPCDTQGASSVSVSYWAAALPASSTRRHNIVSCVGVASWMQSNSACQMTQMDVPSAALHRWARCLGLAAVNCWQSRRWPMPPCFKAACRVVWPCGWRRRQYRQWYWLNNFTRYYWYR